MERELPLEAMHPLVDAAGKTGATALLNLLREVARGRSRTTHRRETFFIAWEKSVVVAVVALVEVPHERGMRVAQLRGLFVQPEKRRRGLGKALVDRAVRHAATTVHEVRIVDPDHRQGAFYAAAGFARGNDRSTWVRVSARPTT
jgi:predicted N-acetyltransferase YhbS